MVYSDLEISSGFVISTFSVLYMVLFAWRVPRTPIELQYSWHKALLVPRLFEAFLIARQEQTAKEQCEARAVRWGNSLLHQKISRHLDHYYHLRCISYLHCKIVAIYIINRQEKPVKCIQHVCYSLITFCGFQKLISKGKTQKRTSCNITEGSFSSDMTVYVKAYETKVWSSKAATLRRNEQMDGWPDKQWPNEWMNEWTNAHGQTNGQTNE